MLFTSLNCRFVTIGLSNTSIPGSLIIKIQGMNFQITSVKMEPSYADIKPTDPMKDILLLISANPVGIIKNEYFNSIPWWGETLIVDENKRESKMETVTTSSSSSSKYLDLDKATWVFIVDKASRHFILHYPGGKTISLDSMFTE